MITRAPAEVLWRQHTGWMPPLPAEVDSWRRWPLRTVEGVEIARRAMDGPLPRDLHRLHWHVVGLAAEIVGPRRSEEQTVRILASAVNLIRAEVYRRNKQVEVGAR